jgi:hypothetical protein
MTSARGAFHVSRSDSALPFCILMPSVGKYEGLTTLKKPPERLARSTIGLLAGCIGIP